MKDEPRQPLNVFAIDGKMNRRTGSIPYTSLRWVRRYTKPGEFEMVVPANIYDPSWAFLVCDDRPETGIIQKVEFTDSSQVYGGIDSITLSGFFLESILNNIVFLAESPEEQKVYVPQPRRPMGTKSSSPDVYQDPAGGYWVEQSTGQLKDVITGALIDGDATEGLTKVDYNSAYGDELWGTGYANMRYDYWSSDSEESVTRVDSDGTQTTYDVEFTDDRGNAFYRDESGKLTQATGIVKKASSTYTMRKKRWESLPDDDPYGRYYTVAVKGPWQRTEMMEPVTVGDSIDIVMKWARRMMGDWIIYEEPDIEGVQKSVDPSFQYLGDLLYKTLYEVGASLRLEYVFESNAYVLSVYRGADRTQSDAAAPMAARLMATRSAGVPDGYKRLEWIRSSGGTQWIDTGFTPDQSTRVVLDCHIYDEGLTRGVFGERRGTTGTDCFICWTMNDGVFRLDYGNQKLEVSATVTGRHVIDMQAPVSSIDGTDVQFESATFAGSHPIGIFAIQQNSDIDDRIVDMAVYSCDIYDDGALVRSFVPCKDASGNVGLYDTANQQFYGNAGTGAFRAGPEIAKLNLTYNANNAAATGSTSGASGYPGDAVQVAENGFSVQNMAFTGWNDEAGGGGTSYSPGDAFTFGESDAVLYAQWSAIADSLTYNANADDATGQTPATAGTVGSQVVVAQCGFTRENWQFVGWNSNASGTGAAYQPGDSFTLTSGDDVLYAQWQYVVPGGRAPWAVFSDTWGTLTGYSASRDTSNYKNTCFVLYDYDVPDSFDSNGWPKAGFIYAIDDYLALPTLYGISYTSKRGYNTEHVGDGSEPAIETYLDMRSEKPSCDSDWSRDIVELPGTSGSDRNQAIADAEAKFAPPQDAYDMQAVYTAYESALQGRGEAHLRENYAVETQLDTGTVKTNGYLRDFDLGDLVEMAVSTVGLATQARIIEVEESYTSGNVDIRLTVGDEKLTTIQKARLA